MAHGKLHHPRSESASLFARRRCFNFVSNAARLKLDSSKHNVQSGKLLQLYRHDIRTRHEIQKSRGIRKLDPNRAECRTVMYSCFSCRHTDTTRHSRQRLLVQTCRSIRCRSEGRLAKVSLCASPPNGPTDIIQIEFPRALVAVSVLEHALPLDSFLI